MIRRVGPPCSGRTAQTGPSPGDSATSCQRASASASSAGPGRSPPASRPGLDRSSRRRISTASGSSAGHGPLEAVGQVAGVRVVLVDDDDRPAGSAGAVAGDPDDEFGLLPVVRAEPEGPASIEPEQRRGPVPRPLDRHRGRPGDEQDRPARRPPRPPRPAIRPAPPSGPCCSTRRRRPAAPPDRRVRRPGPWCRRPPRPGTRRAGPAGRGPGVRKTIDPCRSSTRSRSPRRSQAATPARRSSQSDGSGRKTATSTSPSERSPARPAGPPP